MKTCVLVPDEIILYGGQLAECVPAYIANSLELFKYPCRNQRNACAGTYAAENSAVTAIFVMVMGTRCSFSQRSSDCL